MYDRIVDEPRLSKWYRADDSFPHPVLRSVRAALTRAYQVHLSGVGLNYYRTGRDSVAWHRDTELRNLDRTLVAIVTLGAARPFLVRPYGGGSSHDIRPGSGDLLVMGGRAQAKWEHSVPKTASCGPRISASYRWSSGKGAPERNSRALATPARLPHAECGSARLPRRFRAAALRARPHCRDPRSWPSRGACPPGRSAPIATARPSPRCWSPTPRSTPRGTGTAPTHRLRRR